MQRRRANDRSDDHVLSTTYVDPKGGIKGRRNGRCTAALGAVLMIGGLAVVSLVTLSKRTNPSVHVQTITSNSENTCTVYMAQSSQKGNDGNGIYTVKSIRTGEMIHPADGPSIPFPDPSTEHLKGYWWWNGVADDVNFEAESVVDIATSVAALPNHCPYSSLDFRFPTPRYDDTIVNRFKDPAAGAFSYHLGRDFRARRDLQAGDELFLPYGGYNEENSPEWLLKYPRDDEFGAAVKVFREFLTSDVLAYDDPDDKINKELLTLKQKVSLNHGDRAASVLPSTPSELRNVLARGRAHGFDDLGYILAQETTSEHKSVDWIISNGMCLDNLVPRRSSLPQAGQGAFAQRFISKGEMVVPAPLLQVRDRDKVLPTYEPRWDLDEKRFVNDDNEDATQLLVNYCFGNSESSLLLCPLTNMHLINHCSVRNGECGKDGPNAMYRWARGWDRDTETWLKMTIDEMPDPPMRGLAFEVIALRDIQPGEEVFIDYGRAWKNAWDKHVANWKPPAPNSGFDTYTSAKTMNEKVGPLELNVEEKYRNLFTGCIYWDEGESLDDWREEALRIKAINAQSGGRQVPPLEFAEDGSEFYYENAMDRAYWPCKILSVDDQRAGSTRTYTVQILQRKEEKVTPWNILGVPRMLTNYPEKGIRYFNKMYHSDQFLPGAFRHHIEIDDAIFPEQWKNRKDKN